MIELTVSSETLLLVISSLIAALGFLLWIVYHNLKERIVNNEIALSKEVSELRQYVRHEIRNINNNQHSITRMLVLNGKAREMSEPNDYGRS